MIRLAVWVALALGTGAVLGAGLTVADAVDPLGERTEATAQGAVRAPVAYSPCPGDRPIGALHDGDRVLLTGVDVTGSWLELRAPNDLNDRVWLPAQAIDPDRGAEALPVRICGMSLDAPPTSTTSITTSTSTSTTSSTTSTTAGPDTAGPTLADAQVSPSLIYEDGDLGCASQSSTPTRASLSVVVVDDTGIASVRIEIVVAGTRTSADLVAQAGRYTGSVGPFEDDTLAASSADVPVAIRIIATDEAGNVTAESRPPDTLQLRDCSFG